MGIPVAGIWSSRFMMDLTPACRACKQMLVLCILHQHTCVLDPLSSFTPNRQTARALGWWQAGTKAEACFHAQAGHTGLGRLRAPLRVANARSLALHRK